MFEIMGYGMKITATLIAGAILAGLTMLGLMVATRLTEGWTKWLWAIIILLMCIVVIYKFNPDEAFYKAQKLEMAILITHNSGKNPIEKIPGLVSAPASVAMPQLPPPTTDQEILTFSKYYYSIRPAGYRFVSVSTATIQEIFAVDILVEYKKWLKGKEVEQK